MLCDNQEGWGGHSRHRGYTHTYTYTHTHTHAHTHTMADSHFYIAETNTTLLSNYPAIKNKMYSF